jgi:hypothetical protein
MTRRNEPTHLRAYAPTRGSEIGWFHSPMRSWPLRVDTVASEPDLTASLGSVPVRTRLFCPVLCDFGRLPLVA